MFAQIGEIARQQLFRKRARQDIVDIDLGEVVGLDPNTNLHGARIGQLVAERQDDLVIDILATDADKPVFGLELFDLALGRIQIGAQRVDPGVDGFRRPLKQVGLGLAF